MMPIRGIKLISHHQPLRSVSCSLRTPIASDGRNVTKLQIDESGITSLDNTASIKLLEKIGFSLEGMITPPEGEDLNLFSLDLPDRT